MGSAFLIDSKPLPVYQECFDLSDFLCQDKIILCLPLEVARILFFALNILVKLMIFVLVPFIAYIVVNVFLQLINNSRPYYAYTHVKGGFWITDRACEVGGPKPPFYMCVVM